MRKDLVPVDFNASLQRGIWIGRPRLEMILHGHAAELPFHDDATFSCFESNFFHPGRTNKHDSKGRESLYP